MASRPLVERLRQAIADALYPTKSYKLPGVCQEFGLAEGTVDEAHQSKNKYVLNRLPNKLEDLVRLANEIHKSFQSYNLEETLWLAEDASGRKTTEHTRRQVLNVLLLPGHFTGRLNVVETLKRVWPIGSMNVTSDALNKLGKNAAYGYFVAALTLPLFSGSLEAFINENMISEPGGLTVQELFRMLDVLNVSERRFFLLLETLVNPPVRYPEDGQQAYADELNRYLRRDGVELRPFAEESGYPIYLLPAGKGVMGRAKNLIFASNGPKPEIIFKDAINNDIKVIKNEEFCLIYERSFPLEGLLWKHLVDWWIEQEGIDPANKDAARRGLGKRLMQSLVSPPEKPSSARISRLFFRSSERNCQRSYPKSIFTTTR